MSTILPLNANLGFCENATAMKETINQFRENFYSLTDNPGCYFPWPAQSMTVAIKL
jgi:hypothetical protein